MPGSETRQKIDTHDNIVSVNDCDDDPVPWVAMEYTDSGHLGRDAGAMEAENVDGRETIQR